MRSLLNGLIVWSVLDGLHQCHLVEVVKDENSLVRPADPFLTRDDFRIKGKQYSTPLGIVLKYFDVFSHGWATRSKAHAYCAKFSVVANAFEEDYPVSCMKLNRMEN